MNAELYWRLAQKSSKQITTEYSTSFRLATRLLSEPVRSDVFAVYGLVRLADELVDTLRPDNVEQNLQHFEAQVLYALEGNITLNLVVDNFAKVAKARNIETQQVRAFFASMALDVAKKSYKKNEYNTYIYGSAEVVGLMCLRIFVGGTKKEYMRLQSAAQALGSAFQKVNFLRDLGSDNELLGRMYFPGVVFKDFSEPQKQKIIAEIEAEFLQARAGIDSLPGSSRYGVMLAYYYYQQLLFLLKKTPVQELSTRRLRVGGFTKLRILIKIVFRKLFAI